MWIIAVIIIGSLLALVILLLSIPFDLAMELDVHGKPKFRLSFAWFFGLIKKEVEAKRKAAKPKKPEKKAGLPKKRGISRALNIIQTATKILETKGFVSQITRLIRRTIRHFKIRKLEADWIVGLDDPYESFYLFTLTEPVNRLLNYSLPYPVSIRTSFIEPVLEGYVIAGIRLYPILLVPPLVQFVFSVPTLRVIRQVIGSRWRRDR